MCEQRFKRDYFRNKAEIDGPFSVVIFVVHTSCGGTRHRRIIIVDLWVLTVLVKGSLTDSVNNDIPYLISSEHKCL